MNSRKKPSVISEPTQPQRLKHFIRRNSIHTLHCRSGSLNKLTPYSEDLINLETNPEEIPEHPTKRRQTFDANARELINDLQDSPQISIKRASGSMQLRPCCRDKNKLIQKYQNLKKKYDKRGLQLNQLEHKCRELSKISHEEHSKRKKLQQELKLNKQELKRVQKRIEKYRIEKQEYQNEREIMSRHIDSIQKLKFNHSLVTVQNYREQILEKELEKVKEQLGKGRSGREEELLSEVHRLTDQKYNLEMLHSRTQVANNMLTKQLQQTEQYLQEMRQGIGQAVTTSVEYIQLRDRYRRTLLEMKDLRKEILQLERSEGSSILSISMLSASQSMRCQQ